jgi:ABC-2 type transport system ATP-binding protein
MSASNDVVLRTEKLTKIFSLGLFTYKAPDVEARRSLRARKVEALVDLDLEVKSGEIFGFVGPNGAGKTTTLKILASLIQPTRGHASIFGRTVNDPDAKRAMGFLPENPYFYDYLKPEEFLHFCAKLFGLSSSERRARVDALLAAVGLEHARGRPLRRFSKGMLQRIGIAQALINDPKLVVLDEPMSGLDPVGRREVRDLIARLRDEGRTVFFSTHILSDVELLCDRVALVVGGRLRGMGPIHALVDPKVIETSIVASGVTLEVVRARLPSDALAIEQPPGEADVFVRLPGGDGVSEVLSALLSLGAVIQSVTPRKQSLEDLFVREVRS